MFIYFSVENFNRASLLSFVHQSIPFFGEDHDITTWIVLEAQCHYFQKRTRASKSIKAKEHRQSQDKTKKMRRDEARPDETRQGQTRRDKTRPDEDDKDKDKDKDKNKEQPQDIDQNTPPQDKTNAFWNENHTN